MAAVFTADNEPYLGRESVFHFDQMILAAMDTNASVGPWTRDRELTPLQSAATELIPHGFSIGLSIRELIRQGYLISAEILLRPLIERAAVVSFLSEMPDAIPLWAAGWPHKTRPPLYKMLATIGIKGTGLDDGETQAKMLTQHFNAIVHADPLGARRQKVRTEDGRSRYTVSKSLNDNKKCDDICFQAAMYLIVLTARAVDIFPEAIASVPQQ